MGSVPVLQRSARISRNRRRLHTTVRRYHFQRREIRTMHRRRLSLGRRHRTVLLAHCADNGVVFNPEKFRFARETVEFSGFDVTMDGFRPASHLLSSIKDFPTPKNAVDVRSWFGLVNQVAYTFAQNRVMDPFRDLMKKGQRFYWDDTLEALFQRSKTEIVRQAEEGVRTYEPTCLTTDWCKTGLGFALTQKHCKCSGDANPGCGSGHWKLVFASS